MPTGHVKIYHPDRKFGFVTAEDGKELFVSGDDISGDALHSGDEVTFEVGEDDDGRRAVDVEVVKAAPADNPVGRTMASPPAWGMLEDRERQRRQNRRRRR